MKYLKYFLVLLMLTSCLGEGTDTGNPEIIETIDGDQDTTSPVMKGTAIIADEICSVIRDCQGQEKSDCRLGLKDQDNIDTKLGLMDGDFATFQDILDAEEDDLMTPDNDALKDCYLDIKDLTCSDPKVDDAYDATDTVNPYRNAAEMFPVSCEDLYN